MYDCMSSVGNRTAKMPFHWRLGLKASWTLLAEVCRGRIFVLNVCSFRVREES